MTPDQALAERAVVEHIEPVAVTRSLSPEHCPYCAGAGLTLPCALHRDRA